MQFVFSLTQDSNENQKKPKGKTFTKTRGYNFRRLSQITAFADESKKAAESEEETKKSQKKRPESPSRKERTKEVKKVKKEGSIKISMSLIQSPHHQKSEKKPPKKRKPEPEKKVESGTER
jgi:flagellar biosynthesis component FlhA